ncbi:MAG: beta-ketoacyl synthase N-terminal-like domain-containing protein, partial [Planctomycetota bacterium]
MVPERHSPAESFRLSQDDIVNADPTHLELCQVAADALRDAGVDPDHPKPDRCGVFIGHQRGSTLIGDLSLNAMAGQALNCLRETEYFSQQSSDHQRSLVREMTARVRSDLPGWLPGGGPFLGSSEAARLISKAFGLDGPYASINAACSSSLVALATGAHALQMGDIEMAVVGGASNCKLDALILFSQAQTLSATGSRPFDATADGLVAAEGYVVVLVKTLQRAIADRDPIQAVIRGIGVSSDGKGKSLWAPRRDGQVAAIRRAYRQDTTPESVQYIEAHATSTPVGDSTEINSLGDVFAESIKPGGKIAIGSVKANIGHTLESAGLAGLVKTVLAMRHGVIPPLINLTQPNPKVDWQALPFVLPTSPMNWPQPTASNPKRAAINAFGIGGLNVHVTVEEYRASSRVSVATPNKQSTEDRSIAIVGASLMTPGARTIEAFWEMMTKGIDPKTAIPLDRWDVRIDHPAEAENWVGGFISGYQYDWKKHHVPPKQLTSADPLQFMILDAVGDALDRNDYLKRLDREHTAVVVANVVGGEYTEQLQVGLRLPVLRETLEEVLGAKGVPPDTIDSVSHHFAELVLRRMPALLDETGGFSNSSLATRVTKTYDLMGGAFAIDSGDNTSLAAIDSARRLLLCGGCSTVIVAAGQRSLGPGTFERLKRSGRLSAAGRSCALDRDSDGMAPAEGVAVVVLKRLSDARATGDEVLSVIRETGIARSDDAISAQRLAIRRALDGADVRSEQIAAVDLSACGVSSEDRNELEAIAGEYAGARPHPMHLRTLASQIGDAGGAAGLISLVKSSLSLRSLESPAGQPPRRPIVEPDFGSTMARWWQLPNANEPLLAPDPNGRVLAAIHSYSNGLACHLVLEREQAVETRRATPKAPSVSTNPNDESNDFGTWYAQADTVSSLLALASEIATGGSAEEATVDGVPARHGLAIVYRSRAELRKKAELFISRHEHPQRQAVFESQGIYSFDRRDQPLVAFLFPGQGSQYAGMLEPLIQQHSVASNVAAHIDTNLTALQYPTIHELFGDQDQQLGRDVWRTQLSVLVADTILYEVVSDMGIRPDRISSHSYGEFAALVAAGCWS